MSAYQKRAKFEEEGELIFDTLTSGRVALR